MYDVFVFAGTSEGRRIADYLRTTDRRTCVFTATDYGGSLIPESQNLRVCSERLDREAMEERMRSAGHPLIIDATHPYAAEVTENIRKAAAAAGCRVLRVLRESDYSADSGDVIVRSPEEAAAYLAGSEGNVLLTTGSKELPCFTKVPDYQNRIYARVLPLPKVVSACSELGFDAGHLICMQGPFSEEMNLALLRQTRAKYLVTKDTGLEGGFPEKEAAARKLGVRLVLIRRPSEESGITVDECLRILGREEKSAPPDASGEQKSEAASFINSDRVIYLVGIGMGGNARDTMTAEAHRIIRDSDLLIGAERMLEAQQSGGQARFAEYRAESIADYLNSHPEFRQVSILLSGDAGFYSGAKKLLTVLPSAGFPEENIHVIPGISSLVYFCSKLGISWDDARITSVHGKQCNLVGEVASHRKVFTILGTKTGAAELCRRFLDYGLENLRIAVGENLSYDDEKILRGSPHTFSDYEGSALACMMIENDDPDEVVNCGIPDEEFIRARVPMTKEEVREVSVSKLRLHRDSVCYDVGAGSGSCTVEIARAARNGTVYAVEKNPEAVRLLHENCRKFRADNVRITEGEAPEVLRDLPAPTHVFIGGSSGHMEEIIRLILSKNPYARVVINAITLETVGEALDVIRRFSMIHADVVSVTAAKAREVGRYHMMMGQNPVYILSADGCGKNIPSAENEKGS